MNVAPDHIRLPGALSEAPTVSRPGRGDPITIHIAGQPVQMSEAEALETIGVLAGILEGRARG
jgi:hypothetical protein